MMADLSRRNPCGIWPLFLLLLTGITLAGCSRVLPGAPSVQKSDSVKTASYPWGWIRWMMNSELDPSATQTLGIVQLEAGQQNPKHKHPNCEEMIYVISGTVENVVGDQRILLREGDILRIPAGVPHQAFNRTDKPAQTLVVYNTGTRQMVTLDTGTE